ncbi:MAG: hypothetical protein LBP38_03445 [Desulfovibrio sp.]|jgi:hypothetical protein|nr:hypothetical protein [Desulfovibrio sp.]
MLIFHACGDRDPVRPAPAPVQPTPLIRDTENALTLRPLILPLEQFRIEIAPAAAGADARREGASAIYLRGKVPKRAWSEENLTGNLKVEMP